VQEARNTQNPLVVFLSALSPIPIFVLLYLHGQSHHPSRAPPELTARALAFVADGWISDFNDLLAGSLRRFLEPHSARVSEAFVLADLSMR
jgi:hypothetical protein